MKRNLLILTAAIMLSALLMAAYGCRSNTPAPSPSPVVTTDPGTVTQSPGTIPGGTENSPAVDETGPGAENPAGTDGAAGGITGFTEGGTVDPANAQSVVDAIKAKYPDAAITAITFETYGGNQMYHVVLDQDTAEGKEFYVDANGTVSPVTGTGATGDTAAE